MCHVVCAVFLILPSTEPGVAAVLCLCVRLFEVAELQFDVCVDGAVDNDDG